MIINKDDVIIINVTVITVIEADGKPYEKEINMGITAVFIILFWAMCNIIVITGTRKDARNKHKTFYEEWWEGSDVATHVVMTIFFPMVSVVAFMSWKRQR